MNGVGGVGGVSGVSGAGGAGGADGAGARRGAPRLEAQDVRLAYDGRVVVGAAQGLSLAVPDRSFTVVVGPNACGKSTLLRAFSRLLRPSVGRVVLDGEALAGYRPKEAARRIGLLPQSAVAPEGITAGDLVARGRYPHQGLVRQWSAADEAATARAMAATGVTALRDRPVEELSGGQRQRVWVAVALAQDTPLLLLDEPTTFLDITHQVELLDLFAELHEGGTTVVAVLHDLNHAARYATHLVVMKDGAVVTTGAPADVLTAQLVEEVYGLACVVVPDPVTGTPLVVPLGRSARRPA